MFKAWQVVVSIGATAFLLASISAGTPFWVAVASALLAMSILASDSGTSFAVSALRHSRRFRNGRQAMQVKISRTWKGMPEGAQVGDEVDIPDDQFAEQRRLGNVERAQAQGGQAGKQPQNVQAQDRPQAGQGDKTSVEPLTTQRYGGDDSNR